MKPNDQGNGRAAFGASVLTAELDGCLNDVRITCQ